MTGPAPITYPAAPEDRNPRLQKMQSYADALIQLRQKDPNDPAIRDLRRLLQLGFHQESRAMVEERNKLSAEERAALDQGPTMAALLGAMEGLASAEGFSAGMAAGAPLAPFAGPAAPAVPVATGIIGAAIAGYAANRGLKAAGVPDETRAATISGNKLPWYLASFAAGFAAPPTGRVVAARVGAKTTTARATADKAVEDALRSRADRITAEANASVAQQVANAEAARKASLAREAALKVAREEIRMAHPSRAAAAQARYDRLLDEARTVRVKADAEELDLIMKQERAAGVLSPAEQAKIQHTLAQINRTNAQTDLIRQQIDIGRLKPEQIQTALERTRTQIGILENNLTTSGVRAGMAFEEATTKLAALKNQLILLQDEVVQRGLTPAVSPASSIGQRVNALGGGPPTP